DPQDNLQLGLQLLDAAGKQGADFACLPEGFVAAGIPGERLKEIAEPIPGPAFDAVADCARRYGMYVVAGFHTKIDGLMYNLAALIDRSGELVGIYAKNHPTEGEIACGVTPVGEVPVFKTDFGRVGLGICFDVNWQPFWQELEEKGADL